MHQSRKLINFYTMEEKGERTTQLKKLVANWELGSVVDLNDDGKWLVKIPEAAKSDWLNTGATMSSFLAHGPYYTANHVEQYWHFSRVFLPAWNVAVKIWVLARVNNGQEWHIKAKTMSNEEQIAELLAHPSCEVYIQRPGTYMYVHGRIPHAVITAFPADTTIPLCLLTGGNGSESKEVDRDYAVRMNCKNSAKKFEDRYQETHYKRAKNTAKHIKAPEM